MSVINQTEVVKKQYESSTNLSTRISIHEKYSTNKIGFGNWIFSNYKIVSGCRILELGCGTGDMWTNHDDVIAQCSEIVLSDFSEGMLNTAKEKLNGYDKIKYKVIDIQQIPFEDGTFDIVIANMMLYHVPDIKKALTEVRRVLKSGGSFYCATFGEHGIIEHLSKLLGEFGVEDKTNKNFTLQNGEQILNAVFGQVERLDYKDSLAVTNVGDLVEYIYSLVSMTDLNQMHKEDIRITLERHKENGVLNVPKEYGMFICRK